MKFFRTLVEGVPARFNEFELVGGLPVECWVRVRVRECLAAATDSVTAGVRIFR